MSGLERNSDGEIDDESESDDVLKYSCECVCVSSSLILQLTHLIEYFDLKPRLSKSQSAHPRHYPSVE